ncbi:hypothetical protein ACFDTO_25365 [Microbacteriaceae bacterium 4G12]
MTNVQALSVLTSYIAISHFRGVFMSLYVRVCICVAPGADTRDKRLKHDIYLSQKIWNPISFQIDHVIQLDSSYTFHDREISYITPFKYQKKVYRLLQHCTTLSSKSDIYVCYVGGNYFQEPNVIACAHSHYTNGRLKGFILLTNRAASSMNMYTLAHEFGHILFTRWENGHLINTDPDSPNGSVHHPNAENLMHKIIPVPKRKLNHLLSSNQRLTAMNSPLFHKH